MWSALDKEEALGRSGVDDPEARGAIQKDWQQAEIAYFKVVAGEGGDYKDWYNYGNALQRQNEGEKNAAAIRAYEKSISLNSDYAASHFNLADLYESSNVGKAFEHYERALSLGRRIPPDEERGMVMNSLAALGELSWRTGNKGQAAEYLTEYIQYAPDDTYIEEMLEQITSEPL